MFCENLTKHTLNIISSKKKNFSILDRMLSTDIAGLKKKRVQGIAISCNVLLCRANRTDSYDCLLLPFYRVFIFIAAPNTATSPIENKHLSRQPLTVAEIRKTKKHTVVANGRCERHVASDLLALQM